MVWVAAPLALTADWWMPGQGMAMLAAAIVAVIAINGAFSFWQEYRAEETMAALQRLLPHQVRTLRNGTTVVLASEDVVPGDVIFLTAGRGIWRSRQQRHAHRRSAPPVAGRATLDRDGPAAEPERTAGRHLRDDR